MTSSAPFVKILNGDVLEHLHELPDESIQCCVTSPPYWGLRDYSRCGCSLRPHKPGEFESNGDAGAGCPICNGTGIIEGTEQQIGIEATLEEYISKLVQVFREVKRVLRSDGTLWVNMGDCYYSPGERHHNGWSASGGCPQAGVYAGNLSKDSHLKPKDLVGQPWRLAFALQDDGWYLRLDIIWNKKNPMPESVKDRPTKAHEYIFLLSKSPRYFYDNEAVREREKECTINHNRKYTLNLQKGCSPDRTPGEVMGYFSNPSGRNLRSVWDIATQPYPDAHFATFPEELPRKCIRAGTSEKGACPRCGAPWERVIERKEPRGSYHTHSEDMTAGQSQPKPNNISGQDWYNYAKPSKTIGWQPTCSCGLSETVPCVVLDPFAGSGTSGAVAQSMGRSSILIELNSEYVKLMRKRVRADHVPIDTFYEEVSN